MTYYCSGCDVAWHPYQCPQGACSECGKGTVRKNEPASPDADSRFKAAMAVRVQRERSEHNHKLFEDFCRRRDAEQDAAFLRSLAIQCNEAQAEQQWGEEDVAV